MSAAHTPGVWVSEIDKPRLGGFAITSKENSLIALAYVKKKGPYVDLTRSATAASARANARLIAAAPELLDALKGLLAIVGDSRGVTGYHRNGNEAYWDEFADVDAARAAVAKAEGGAA